MIFSPNSIPEGDQLPAASAKMRVQTLLYIFLLILASLLLAIAQKPDFLNPRRKFHKHHCPHRRCMPLHSKVPFP